MLLCENCFHHFFITHWRSGAGAYVILKATNFLLWSQGHWNTVLSRCTKILCSVCWLYVGDHKLGFVLRMTCYVEMCFKVLLNVCIFIMKQSNQVHGPLASCCWLVLVPKHVRIVVVSMVTFYSDLFFFRFYQKIGWWLLDNRRW